MTQYISHNIYAKRVQFCKPLGAALGGERAGARLGIRGRLSSRVPSVKRWPRVMIMKVNQKH